MPDPATTDPARYLDAVADIARRAGEAILEVYERADHAVRLKGDQSPLTDADMASHRVITEALAGLEPAVPVLSEESADLSYETRGGWRRFWLVDPLDGTKEFVKRNGEFTVNIALIEDGAPVLGVVHTPVTGVTHLAAVGAGARRRGPGGEVREIRSAAPEEKLVVAVSRSHAGDETERLLAALAREWELERVSRGSALKICLVAEGAAHLYPRLGPTSEWDTAAAQCVVEQAGGTLTTLDGRPLRYNKRELLNPHFLVAHGEPERWLAYLPNDPSA